MLTSFRKAVREGFEFGLCAGLVLTLAEIVVALVQRQPTFYSLRVVASDLLGAGAIENLPPGTALLGGIFVHLAIAALFGVVYGVLNLGFSPRTQMRWDRQAIIGLLFGAAVWAVKWQLLARYVHPAFLQDRPFQFLQLTLHTFCYGWPLALFYTSAERRLAPLRLAMQQE